MLPVPTRCAYLSIFYYDCFVRSFPTPLAIRLHGPRVRAIVCVAGAAVTEDRDAVSPSEEMGCKKRKGQVTRVHGLPQFLCATKHPGDACGRCLRSVLAASRQLAGACGSTKQNTKHTLTHTYRIATPPPPDSVSSGGSPQRHLKKQRRTTRLLARTAWVLAPCRFACADTQLVSRFAAMQALGSCVSLYGCPCIKDKTPMRGARATRGPTLASRYALPPVA